MRLCSRHTAAKVNVNHSRYNKYTDTDQAQSAASVLLAHWDSSGAAARPLVVIIIAWYGVKRQVYIIHCASLQPVS